MSCSASYVHYKTISYPSNHNPRYLHHHSLVTESLYAHIQLQRQDYIQKQLLLENSLDPARNCHWLISTPELHPRRTMSRLRRVTLCRDSMAQLLNARRCCGEYKVSGNSGLILFPKHIGSTIVTQLLDLGHNHQWFKSDSLLSDSSSSQSTHSKLAILSDRPERHRYTSNHLVNTS